MKRISSRVYAVWGITLATLAVSLAHAHGQLALKLSVLDAALTASSRTESKARGSPSKTIQSGEPLSVRLELTNPGAQPVDIRSSLDPAAGFVHLQVSFETGPPERFTVTRWETKDILVKTRPLPAGAKLVHETFLYGKMNSTFRENYLFEKEGTYKLQAFFGSQDPPVSVESNPVLIQVGPPVPNWNELKQAGIVDLIEGKFRSHREESNAAVRIEAILKDQPRHPMKAWVEEKTKTFQRSPNQKTP